MTTIPNPAPTSSALSPAQPGVSIWDEPAHPSARVPTGLDLLKLVAVLFWVVLLIGLGVLWA